MRCGVEFLVSFLLCLALCTQDAEAFAVRSQSFDGNGLVVRDFYDFTHRESARDATVASLRYTASELIVHFQCEQTNAPVVHRQTTNGLGFGTDDYAGVAFDPSGNTSRVYDFEITPGGVRYQHASESTKYDPRWSGSAQTNGNTWSATMSIPLDAIRGQTRSPQRWRMNFFRHFGASQVDYTWAYDPVMSDPISSGSYWPLVTNLDIPPAATKPPVMISPYILETAGRNADTFLPPGGSAYTAAAPVYGLDASIPITSTLSAVTAINPDFSNVEADQTTISPQEFQRVLTEYRPFFSQGSTYLNPSFGSIDNGPTDYIFYSPSLDVFNRGLKLEGTSGDVAIGALDVVQPSANDFAYGLNYLIMRGAHQFRAFGDGAIVRRTAENDGTNQGGFDLYNMTSGFNVGGQYALEQTSGVGVNHSAYGFVEMGKPNYDATLGYIDVSPGYGPFDGFTRINDIKGPAFAVFFTGSGASGAYIKKSNAEIVAERFVDYRGSAHYSNVVVNAGATNRHLWGVQYQIANSFVAGSPFIQSSISAAYRDGTESPVHVTYQWGPFGDAFLNELSADATRQFTQRLSSAITVVTTSQRPFAAGNMQRQTFLQLSTGYAFGNDANASIGLRSVGGAGSAQIPGTNFSASLHVRTPARNDLYFEYGSPSSSLTLNRWLLKYVWNVQKG